MKILRFLSLVLVAISVAGCLTTTDPVVYRWTVEYSGKPVAAKDGAKPPYGVVRILQVSVRSPFDTERISVQRSDGTLAFDSLNEFASAPAVLLRGPVFDAVNASGRFEDAVLSSSIAKSSYTAEVVVSRLCLDCREEGKRRAVCEVRFRLLKDRDIVRRTVGEGVVDATDGDYGKAFSKAVSLALDTALQKVD